MQVIPLRQTVTVLYGGGDGIGGVTTTILKVYNASSAPAWDGSLVVNAILPDNTAIALQYLVKTSGAVTAAGTPITAEGIYEFSTNGLPLQLVYTHTAGSAQAGLQSLTGTSSLIASSGGGGDVNITEVGGNAVTTAVPVTTIPSAFTVGQVALNDTTDTQIVAANASRTSLMISNPDATNAIYLGPSGVTSGTGYCLAPLSSVSFGLASGAVYGISASGTPSATFVQT